MYSWASEMVFGFLVIYLVLPRTRVPEILEPAASASAVNCSSDKSLIHLSRWTGAYLLVPLPYCSRDGTSITAGVCVLGVVHDLKTCPAPLWS